MLEKCKPSANNLLNLILREFGGRQRGAAKGDILIFCGYLKDMESLGKVGSSKN